MSFSVRESFMKHCTIHLQFALNPPPPLLRLHYHVRQQVRLEVIRIHNTNAAVHRRSQCVSRLTVEDICTRAFNVVHTLTLVIKLNLNSFRGISFVFYCIIGVSCANLRHEILCIFKMHLFFPSSALLLLYDVTNKASFDNIRVRTTLGLYWTCLLIFKPLSFQSCLVLNSQNICLGIILINLSYVSGFRSIDCLE